MVAALHLSEDEEELITVAAYLHDVGMRELDYARVYRMERPGEQERRLYQRHPVVGARIVEAAEFPGDLAGAIRHHHERWDGAGLPPAPGRPRTSHSPAASSTSPRSTTSSRRPRRTAAPSAATRRSTSCAPKPASSSTPTSIPILAEVVRA